MWKDILNDFKHRENIDIYATFLVSVIVGVVGIITTSSVIFSLAILFAVNVLLYGTLAIRRMLSEQASTLLKDRSEFRPLRDDLKEVDVVWLCGPSLVVMFTTYKNDFLIKLRHGGKVRALVFKPGKNLPILAECLGVEQSEISAQIETTKEACKGLVRSGLGAGQLELRETEMLPGYSLVILEPSEYKGRMSVELVGYGTSTDERPHIELTASKDRRWFTFFISQFVELWDAASPVDLGR